LRCVIRYLPAPPATTSEASASTHAGATATAAGTSARSVVSAGTPRTSSEGVPISAAAASEIPASDAILTGTAGPIANATTPSSIAHSRSGPVANASASVAIAGQIPALPADLLPGAGLPIRERITAGGAAEPIGRRAVTIGRAAAMLRVMLPGVAGISGSIATGG